MWFLKRTSTGKIFQTREPSVHQLYETRCLLDILQTRLEFRIVKGPPKVFSRLPNRIVDEYTEPGHACKSVWIDLFVFCQLRWLSYSSLYHLIGHIHLFISTEQSCNGCYSLCALSLSSTILHVESLGRIKF